MSVAVDTLNTGNTIPLIGLGCWMGTAGKAGENDEAEAMVAAALKVGYTHFDTASGYGNEEAVGSAIRASGIDRSSLFVTTKLGLPDHGRVAEAFEESLALLDLGYIDLYLMHWPQAIDPATGRILGPEESPTINETWAAMEALMSSGKVKNIGVSNFSVKLLQQLATTSKITPSVNQVESHPFLPMIELSSYCKKNSIHLTAYSPLGQYNSPLLVNKTILDIAEKHGKTAGQVLISWSLQRGGWSVVPKSANPIRLAQNLVTFTLPQGDFDAVSVLHKEPGQYKALCQYGPSRQDGRTVPGQIVGWTFEQLGWDPAAFVDF
ncbi:hypothetical protein RQP46_007797 [Phenoliferia psychrophenolica]